MGPESSSETEAVQTNRKDGIVPQEESLSRQEGDIPFSTQGPPKAISDDKAVPLPTATGTKIKKNTFPLPHKCPLSSEWK